MYKAKHGSTCYWPLAPVAAGLMGHRPRFRESMISSFPVSTSSENLPPSHHRRKMLSRSSSAYQPLEKSPEDAIDGGGGGGGGGDLAAAAAEHEMTSIAVIR